MTDPSSPHFFVMLKVYLFILKKKHFPEIHCGSFVCHPAASFWQTGRIEASLECPEGVMPIVTLKKKKNPKPTKSF